MILSMSLLVIFFAGLNECYKPVSYQFVRRDFQAAFIENEADRWLCIIFGLCVITPSFSRKTEMEVKYKWSQLEFDYRNVKERQNDIDNEIYIPSKPALIDVDVHYSTTPNKRDRIFVTIPRFQPGSPATLGVVKDRVLNNNPIISPYPSWDWHRNPKNCNKDRLISVYRIMIDECLRLWVLDTGRFGESQTCPPQLLAFDLETDQLIHRYEIPEDQRESRSIFVTPVVDVRGCGNTFVYLADCQTYSIIVHDVRKQTSWRVTDKTMYPYPNYGTYTIAGESFDLMDGILGMALTPYIPGQDRKLFYHAMSSATENWVYTSDLRNQSRFENSPEAPEIFHTYRGDRQTQAAAEAMDRNGIMYFGLVSDITFNCWNSLTEYGRKNFGSISRNRETMQFASGVKVTTNLKKNLQELWVVTSRFQKVASGTISTSETNFRINTGKIDDLVPEMCKNRRNHVNPGGGYGLIKPPYSRN